MNAEASLNEREIQIDRYQREREARGWRIFREMMAAKADDDESGSDDAR